MRDGRQRLLMAIRLRLSPLWRLGLPIGLREFGPKESDIDKAVEVISAVKITHPRPVSKADLANVIAQAYAGAPPRF